MKAGFSEVDITPRVGVGLCGFGPYLHRMSIGVRDPLKARAAAFEQGGLKVVIVSCDLVGVTCEITERARSMVSSKAGVPAESIMVHCTHTHSGPATLASSGWGDADAPYIEILPGRIAKACVQALEQLHEVDVFHAESPCEGVALNREYDKDAPPLAECLREDWRPAKPELTDTKCQVIKFADKQGGKMSGFMAYFGCHPVVCCQTTRYIHGDFAGVAMNMLERENPGSIGLFLQGALGDVNTCVVHKPEKEAMLALDIIAARFANSVRSGLQSAKKIKTDPLKCVSEIRNFTLKDIPLGKIKETIAEKEAIVYADGASDENGAVRMATVYLIPLRALAAKMERGEKVLELPAEIQGVKIGPVSLLASPFEVMQAIKNDVVRAAKSEITLVVGPSNGELGYAPDRTSAAKGGYAADVVPMILGRLPYRNMHDELVAALLETDHRLNA